MSAAPPAAECCAAGGCSRWSRVPRAMPSGGRTDGSGRSETPAAVDRQAPRHLPRFDYPDALITPGFVDGHTHFAMWALARRQVRLAGARTRAEAVARVAAGAPSQGWVVGHGWDANGWTEPPDRHALDAVHASPVYLDSLDVHAAWVNSAALAVARVTRETPDPPGGRIVRDAVGRAHRAAAGARGRAGREGGARTIVGDSRRRDARRAGRSASAGRDGNPRRRGRAGLAVLPPAGGGR